MRDLIRVRAGLMLQEAEVNAQINTEREIEKPCLPLIQSQEKAIYPST